ncbi:hypothetical protein A2U01_0083263, partial [Trifolium medium]|nr:hypothetical protein [Trifolium medium]
MLRTPFHLSSVPERWPPSDLRAVEANELVVFALEAIEPGLCVFGLDPP